jgi:hypothetical protein
MRELQHSGRTITRRDLLRGITAAGLAAAASKVTLAGNAGPTLEAFQPVRFAVIGDWGTGCANQMAVGDRMTRMHANGAFDLVVSVGDNIYPDGSPEDFGQKFERPFAGLIETGVPFFTVFGNHDVRNGAEAQLRYPLFNMQGQRYYRVARGNGTIEFFMLDSTDMDARQLAWLDTSLGASSAIWKAVVVHHPPYSSGKRHGSSLEIRRKIEPILARHEVAVVFSGDDHVYQRVMPQQGVQYFVTGAGGQIRKGDLERDDLVIAGYDEDNHFMVLEATTSHLRFDTISAQGETVDTGSLVAPASAVARFLKRFATV